MRLNKYNKSYVIVFTKNVPYEILHVYWILNKEFDIFSY